MLPERTEGDSSWFVHDRFGMFIHWGLYALPARHEWVKSREQVSDEDYEAYFRHFDPDLYDPDLWARAAARAGMKYFVVTTKHHDGFCLWDTAQTDYKVTNTPCGRDLLRPMVEAFRREGFRTGFYHSLLDWHHPHYPIDSFHPQRGLPDAKELNRKRDIRQYQKYLHAQVKELLTGFGKVDALWFDYSFPRQESEYGFPGKGKADWQSEELLKLIRSLQPGVLVNDRLEIDQDFKTPEQFQPLDWVRVKGKPVVWESCHTFSGSWGYHRDEATWKNPAQLIQLLVNSVACGGNLLMNVGPTGRGEFDERALSALDVYAAWMRRHSRSIYGCTQSDYKPPADCRYTRNGNRLYLHIFNWPFRHIPLPGLAGKVEYAQLLHDASEIRWSKRHETGLLGDLDIGIPEDALVLEMPVVKPNVIVPVVEMFLK